MTKTIKKNKRYENKKKEYKNLKKKKIYIYIYI